MNVASSNSLLEHLYTRADAQRLVNVGSLLAGMSRMAAHAVLEPSYWSHVQLAFAQSRAYAVAIVVFDSREPRRTRVYLQP